uniref:E3 ubiquitin-protein ligase n=1 Tax=Glossina brevipalpis TaxID=37001 RepID=A0A1A9WCX4_9MUSC
MDNSKDNLTATGSSVLSSNNEALGNPRDVALTLDQPMDLTSNHTTAISASELTTNITAPLQTSSFSAGTESADTNTTKSNKTPLDVPSTSAAAAAAVSTNDSASALNKDPNDTEPSAPANVLECPICLQTCIHPARLPCGHIFCFLCVKGVAYKNRRCAMCRREIPVEFLNHPQLVNGIEGICSTKATEDGYQWFYEGRNGGWWAYDKRSALQIEEAYQRLLQNLRIEDQSVLFDCEVVTYDIQICGNIYTIDFAHWTQYPQNMPSKERKICRAKNMPVKGVAGISNRIMNRWWQYDDRTSQDIEEAYKKSEKSCTILVAGYVYIVDLETMIQQRQNEPSRCRRVKRDLATIPKKGVAGLRIEGNSVLTDSNFASQLYNQNRQQQNIASTVSALSGIDLRLPLDYVSHIGRDSLSASVGSSSEFVSTIAATDAAIRMASDIIGSTLAHTDELRRPRSLNNVLTIPGTPTVTSRVGIDNSMGELNLHDLPLRSSVADSTNTNTNYSIISSPVSTFSNNHQLSSLSADLNEAAAFGRDSRELLVAAEDLLGTTQRIIATVDQPTIDLFEQTINNFHALTLRNLIDSSDDNEDDDGNDLDNQIEHNVGNNNTDEFENTPLIQRNRHIIDDNTENNEEVAGDNIFHVRQLRF